VRRDRVVEFAVSIVPPGSAPSSSGVHYVKYCVLKVEPLDLAVDLRVLNSLMSLGGRVSEMVAATTVAGGLRGLPARSPSEAVLRSDSRSPDDDTVSTTSSGRWASPGTRSGRFVPAGLRVSSGAAAGDGRIEQPEASGFDTLEELVTSQPDLPWYFERLVIRPTAIRLSLSSSSLGLTPLAYIADIQAAQLRFEAVRLNDVLLPLPELMNRVVSHYRRAIISNVFNVLLSSRFLIAPKTVVEAVGSGLSDFLNELVRGAADVRAVRVVLAHCALFLPYCVVRVLPYTRRATLSRECCLGPHSLHVTCGAASRTRLLACYRSDRKLFSVAVGGFVFALRDSFPNLAWR
jgi:hypothetical protein